MPSSPPANELPENGDASRRRRSLLRLVLVGVGVAAVAIGGTALQAALARDASDPDSTRVMAVHVDEHGIRVGMETTVDEDATLSRPVLAFGDTTFEGSLWPLDGEDHEGEDLDPLQLQAGTPVLIEATVRPPCEGGTFNGTVAMTVSSQPSSGDASLLTFAASNLAELRDAVPEWCDSGPTVRVTGSSVQPDGDAVVNLLVVNPGPDPIEVEVPAFSDEHVDWSAGFGTVPGGAEKAIEILGVRVGCESGETASWEDGRLLIDGEPFAVSSDDGWC